MTISGTAVYTVYPEKKWVDSDTIETWYCDAVANKEVEHLGTNPSLKEMAESLDDAGIITLGSAP